MDSQALLKQPKHGDHIVQLYQDDQALAESVTKYLGAGVAEGEAAIVIATSAHRDAFAAALRRSGVDVDEAVEEGRVRMLDAADTLAALMRGGMPDADDFRRVVGAALADLARRWPRVRAYGEMVDLLWQDGQRDAAVRLEEYWIQLAKVERFSLLCAYFMDALDPRAYEGPLQCICGVHTHFLPSGSVDHLDLAVTEASREVLEEELSQMMLAMAERHAMATQMPLGQKALFWLQKNMPLTAERVIAGARARRET